MNKKTYKQISKGRSFILVDAENAIGASEITEQQVIDLRENVYSLKPLGPMDQVYVASSNHNKIAASFGWPDAARGFNSGEDAADYMLIKKMTDLITDGGFNHVYLVTGDGDMSFYVEYLMSIGIEVTLMARHNGFSTWMQATGAPVMWLDSEFDLAA